MRESVRASRRPLGAQGLSVARWVAPREEGEKGGGGDDGTPYVLQVQDERVG